MFTLVKFTDETHAIYPTKKVTLRDGNTCIVKHCGSKYEACLIASDDTKQKLEKIRETLCGATSDVTNQEKSPYLSANNLLPEKKKAPYPKPKILKIQQLSPTVVLNKLSEQHGSSTSKSNKRKPHEDSSTNGTIEQDNSSIVSGTIIAETDESSSTVDRMDENHNVTTTMTSDGGDNLISSESIAFIENLNKNQIVTSHVEETSSDGGNNSISGGSATFIVNSTKNQIVTPCVEETSFGELDELNPSRNMNKMLPNDVTYDANLNDSTVSLLKQSNMRNSFLNLSDCRFEFPLNDADELLPFQDLLASTPETGKKDESVNLNVNKEESIGEESESVPKFSPRLPQSSEALAQNESSDIEDNDPSYEPQNDLSDSASDAESIPHRTRNKSQNEKEKLPENNSNVSDGMNISHPMNLVGSSVCDDEDMHVEKSRGRNGDKKPNFCFYCHKKQHKIARHLELKHQDEEDVKKFTDLPKNSTERRKIIAIIRKKGNFLFNTQTDYNDGELIVSRRPNPKFVRSARDFRACANCKAFFSRSSLRIHFAKCTGRSSKKTRVVMVMSKKVVARMNSKASAVVRDVLFPPLREDEVVRLIRYDELVITYANKMCIKYKNRRHFEVVRQRLRLLGRFLSTIKKLNKEVTDLSSVYDPKFCDDTLSAINIEAKLLDTTQNYDTPAVASSLGTLIKQIGSILINESIKKHDEPKKKNTKDFLKLFTQEVSISVNRVVAESQMQQKRRKKVTLPSMEDVQKLCTYLEQKRNEAFKSLKQQFSEKTWVKLAETTLTSIQLFNRRRAGEIERTLIEDFKTFHSIDLDTDKHLFNSLSKESQELAKKYVRFTIRGKLNRTVPVLLNTRLLQCIQLLLSHRKNMKISDNNPYVFGLRGAIKSEHKYLRACILLRRFSVECGAAHPERLRGTTLRKHIATLCISMDLSEHEVTDLANYMGHAEKIHKDIYRQPLANREILRMSKLLEAAQGANESDDEDDDDTDEDNREHENDNDARSTNMRTVQQNLSSAELGTCAKRKRSTSPYGSVKRTPWNKEEKETVLRLFGGDLKNLKLPSLKIQEARTQNPCLRNRTSPQIKTWLHNQTRTKKKICFENDAS